MAEASTGGAPQQVESVKDFDKTPAGIQARWDSEIKLAKQEFEPFWKRVAKVRVKYAGEKKVAESSPTNDTADRGMNLLWSTIQTTLPAVYQFPPAVEVSRRFKTKAPVPRVASLLLERYLDVEIDRDNFSSEILAVLQDRLIGSLGQMWVEYEPIIEETPTPVALEQGEDGEYTTIAGEKYTGKSPTQGDDGAWNGEQPYDQVVDCRAPAIHLDIEDFLHSPARVWREVRWVARRHHFSRDEIADKFKQGMEEFKWKPGDIPLVTKPNMSEDDDEKAGDLFKRAEVWQIWSDTEVIYYTPSMATPLQVDKRPLLLKTSRWPCPEPLYGTRTTKSLIPTPDYCRWQELAEEVDELTLRIEKLTVALKVIGARPASEKALDAMFQAGENVLIPVDDWVGFKERGGVEGMTSFLPIDTISAVLQTLQTRRTENIGYINQLNGIADIMRGQGDPRATATQDRIKETYGSLKLEQQQNDLAAFCERVFQIKAEIICEKAPPYVIAEIAGAQELTQADQQVVPQALQLLKDTRVRDIRIDVDEQSMVALKDEAEKASRGEFVSAVVPLIKEFNASLQGNPSIADVIGETLLFAARGYRVGRDMEGTLEQAVDAARDLANKAREEAKKAPPKPSPEQEKAQAAMALADKKLQGDMQKIAAKSQADSQEQRDQAAAEMAAEQMRSDHKRQEIAMELSADERLLVMEHRLKFQQDRASAAEERADAAEQRHHDNVNADSDRQFKAEIAAAKPRPGLQ